MHKYQEELFKVLPSLLSSVKKGSINEITILHDDWCPFLKGIGECNCNPVLVRQPPKIAGANK